MASLANFPKATLPESSIEDMLAYFGFPAIPARVLEQQSPAVIMDFTELQQAVSTAEFDKAYKAAPLAAGEIAVVRFFAPKIINVRDPQTDGVQQKGFGWRKVLRFRARAGSDARKANLDQFYLLFNFTSSGTAFPENVRAGQIQSMLVPTYPTNGHHRDAYFLVYQGLGTGSPGRIGFFLEATFDLETRSRSRTTTTLFLEPAASVMGRRPALRSARKSIIWIPITGSIGLATISRRFPPQTCSSTAMHRTKPFAS